MSAIYRKLTLLVSFCVRAKSWFYNTCLKYVSFHVFRACRKCSISGWYGKYYINTLVHAQFKQNIEFTITSLTLSWWTSKDNIILVNRNDGKSIRVIELISTTITRNYEPLSARSICTQSGIFLTFVKKVSYSICEKTM